MKEDKNRLLREFVSDGVKTFQCVACDATWTNERGPEHHVRCRIGNLQSLIFMLMRERDALRRMIDDHTVERASAKTAMDVVADWRGWARKILGRVASLASEASLRNRLEQRMRAEVSTTERMMRSEIHDLHRRLDAALRANRDLEDLIRRGLEP